MRAGGSKPKADIIFIHANVYTGVPSNTQFSSILREEAIAVRGDRIQAVGKNVDIEKLKGRRRRSSTWAGTSSCRDSTTRTCTWPMPDCRS